MTTTEQWDRVSDSFQESFCRGLNEYDTKLIEFLKENEMIFPGSSVIDIGCGVGKYGNVLAKCGCEVTLTDISEEMTLRAQENLEASGSECWSVYTRDFEEIPLDDPMFGLGFNLSMSTMSPAVYNFDTIKKMTDISNSWCFVSRFSRWNQEMRDRLFDKAGVVTASSMDKLSDDIANIIQCVSRAGYLPMVKYIPYVWEDVRTPDEEIRYLLNRYDFPDQDMAEVESKLRSAISELLDEDGMFHDIIHTQTAWIYWNKDLPENG